ncbi:hypothetical protein [Arthrobacter burdickii]|uniref:Uncharacterized protein n=1 Tax=Arthrobacter burdickii TaxID=3035920 RepID=A0ABT8K0Y3_9MICC|nr:hypothetical protein [Arthrobacter burdickii]MDN4611076.1 hypothetical protein [Arthrobacter burdickii]
MATLGVGFTAAEGRQDSRIDIEDPVGLCSDMWAQNALDPEDEFGAADPGDYDPSGSHPVPNLLTVCVMDDGRAAVIPGPSTVCQDLGLAELPA